MFADNRPFAQIRTLPEMIILPEIVDFVLIGLKLRECLKYTWPHQSSQKKKEQSKLEL